MQRLFAGNAHILFGRSYWVGVLAHRRLPLRLGVDMYCSVFAWESAHPELSCWWKPTGIPSAWGENERRESLETASQGGVAPAGGSSPFYLSSPCLKNRQASSWCGGYRTALRMGTTCQGSKRSWPLAMLWRQLVSSGLPSERFFYKNGKRNPKRLPKNLYTVSSLPGSLKPGVCPRGQTPHQSYTVSEHNQTKDSVFAFKQNHLRRGTTYFHFSSQRRETSCCIFRHLKELRKLI